MMQTSYKTIIRTKQEYDAVRLTPYVTSITLLEITDRGHLYEVTKREPYDYEPIQYHVLDGKRGVQ